MKPRINSYQLKIFTGLFLATLMFIFLLGAGLAAAAAINKASANLSGFLPLILNKPADLVPVTSTGVLIVFSTSATTDGNAGGRTGMNDMCVSEDPASHLCSWEEITNTWTNTGVSFQSPFVRAWVDRATNYYYGDCLGWTSNSAAPSEENGSWIDNNAQNIRIGESYSGPFCNEVYHVACCKWVP